MPGEARHIEDDPAVIRQLQRRVREDPWAANEAARRARLREAGRRPLGRNLSDALELSDLAADLASSLARNVRHPE